MLRLLQGSSAVQLGGTTSKRLLQTTAHLGRYKEWKQLSDENKRTFIHRYVELFKEKHPCSKSNVMYRSLTEGMDEHNDIPYVFGIMYNEVRSVALGESTDNKRGQGILGDPSLESLLVE